MSGELEHANVNTKSIDRMVAFLTLALPNYRVRGGGDAEDGGRWVHIGSDDTYLALNEPGPSANAAAANEPFLNHLGFVVNDAESLRRRLLDAGYEESYIAEPHPYRRRVYFLDPDGNEWEFVEYHASDPAKRNQYGG